MCKWVFKKEILNSTQTFLPDAHAQLPCCTPREEAEWRTSISSAVTIGVMTLSLYLCFRSDVTIGVMTLPLYFCFQSDVTISYDTAPLPLSLKHNMDPRPLLSVTIWSAFTARYADPSWLRHAAIRINRPLKCLSAYDLFLPPSLSSPHLRKKWGGGRNDNIHFIRYFRYLLSIPVLVVLELTV